jgi:exonuclease V
LTPEVGRMATISQQVTYSSSHYGSDIDVDSVSDYGSEFDATEIDEDALLADVLDSIAKKTPQNSEKQSILPSIEFEEGEAEDGDHDSPGQPRPATLRVAKSDIRSTGIVQAPNDIQRSPARRRGPATFEVEYDEPSRRTWSGKRKQSQHRPSLPTTEY